MQVYDTLLFDLDRTPFDFKQRKRQALEAVFRLYNIALTRKLARYIFN